jgi:glycosyltransferase involved in cell wall biosynthesis
MHRKRDLNGFDRMHILMLVTKRQHRGAEVSAANLSRQFISKGHRLTWLGLYPHPAGIQIPGAVNADLPGEGTGFLEWKKIRHLSRLIREFKIDIIQANGSDTLKYAVIAALLAGRGKIVYRNISLISYWVQRSYFKKILYRWLMRGADHVVSVGEASRNDFINTMRFPPDKISVIRRGIPFRKLEKQSARQQLLKTFALPSEAFVLVWAGSFSSEKDPFLAIETFRCISKNLKPIYLIMAGAGPLESQTHQLIAHYDLTDRILLLGHRSDLDLLLAGSNLLLLTSAVEGVPGVVLEAAIQETPSVCTNVGGVREVIIEGITGILIEERSAQHLSNAITELIHDASRVAQMGKSAQQWVKEEFDEQKNTIAFENLYQQLLRS